MKTTCSNAVVACAVAVAALFAGSASAAPYNPFTVMPTGPFVPAPFTADKITGLYSEVLTFNGDGTFNMSLYWKAGQFVIDKVNQDLDIFATGLGLDYSLYATYTASGFVKESGTTTTLSFLPGTGVMNMYLDDNVNTGTMAPTAGNQPFGLTNTGDDILLATGTSISGIASQDLSLSTCGGANGGINCGSFDSSTTFALTAPGSNFFIAPYPFYNLSFQTGQLNPFMATGTQLMNGSLDVVFANAVPEPASLSLLGLGLLGLGMARRRKQA